MFAVFCLQAAVSLRLTEPRYVRFAGGGSLNALMVLIFVETVNAGSHIRLSQHPEHFNAPRVIMWTVEKFSKFQV